MANTLNPGVNNQIALASRFLPLLDDVYKRASLTAIMDTMTEQVDFTGAKTVNIFNVDVDGLGNYDRNNGFVPGSSDGAWEPHTIQIDRGRRFVIDAMDNDETLGMMFASTLNEFERTQVIPEVDAYRFAAWAAGAAAENKVTAAITDSTSVVDLIQTAEAAMDDAEVPYEGRILYVSPSAYKVFKGNITRFTENGDPDVNGNVEMYDDMRVIRVPKARFNTQVTLNAPTSAEDFGGFTLSGQDIHFMIVHPTAILQTVKHRIPRVFSPEVFQDADGWALDYRIYHDTWVKAKKTSGIYVCSASA